VAIVTLDEVKARVNDASSANDYELEGFVASAQAVVEAIVGPVEPRDVEEWLDGGGPTVVLRHFPVVEVTLVEEYAGTVPSTLVEEPLSGGSFTSAGYLLDAEIGTLTRTVGGAPSRFVCGQGNVRVQYVAGYADGTVPANYKDAVLELIRENWGPQRAAGPSTLGVVGEITAHGGPRTGFFVPGRVKELLNPPSIGPVVV